MCIYIYIYIYIYIHIYLIDLIGMVFVTVWVNNWYFIVYKVFSLKKRYFNETLSISFY